MGDKGKVGLVAAGLDPCGGAGILLDVRVFSRFGLHTCGVITANTVQNSCGAKGWTAVDEKIFIRQLETLREDFHVGVVKVGMLARAGFLKHLLSTFGGLPFVVDPVLFSKNGKPLLDNPEIYLSHAGEIFLITPNLVEARYLTSSEGEDEGELLFRLRELGFRNVLLKGGHSDDPAEVVDYLLTEDGEIFTYKRKRLNIHPRGTGCLLSSAVAANWLLYGNVKEAFLKAEKFVDETLKRAKKLGRCHEILIV